MYRFLLTFAVGCILVPQISRADMIYTNLGPGNTYFASAGGGVIGTEATLFGSPLQPSKIAVQFTPTSDYYLNEIDVALSNVNGTDGAGITLTSDLNDLPGDPLETWRTVDLPSFGSTNSILQKVQPVDSLELFAGTPYWIVVSALAPNTYDVWNLSANDGTGLGGPIAVDSGMGYVRTFLTTDRFAFSVLGTLVVEQGPPPSVPEPGTLSLAAMSLLGMLSVTRWHKRRSKK